MLQFGYWWQQRRDEGSDSLGVGLTTSYLSDSYLVAQVPASNLANPGIAEISVLTPGPGGGSSTSLLFGINGFNYTPLVVSQLANDMVWDPTNQVIYLSVRVWPRRTGIR
jgi:trimeric autotransporter adhesin